MSNPRSLSIVVPFYNKKAAFRRTFAELLMQMEHDDEIVVADDHSETGIGVCACLKEIEVIKPPKLSSHVYRVNTLRNLGVEAAKNDAIIILDPDCIPNEHFLSNARKIFDPSVLFTGRIDHVDKDGMIDRLDSRVKGESSQWLDHPMFGGASIWGGCMMFSKSRAELVGLFDEDYNGSWGTEDHDFGYRCYHSGMRLRWEPGLRVTHQWHEKNHPNVEANKKLWRLKRKKYEEALGIMTPYDPAVVVLIATLDRPEYIDQVMRAVFRTRVSIKVRLVNQGNFSKENMKALEPWRNRWAVEVIDNEFPVGLAEVRTQCMKDYASRYKYMITLDDDVLPKPGSIERLLAAMETYPQYHAIAGGVMQGKQSRMLGGRIDGKHQHYYLPIVDGVVEVQYVSSGFTVSKLVPFIPYDIEYDWGWNDWDWSNEIAKKDLRMAVCGNALGYHKHLITSKGLVVKTDSKEYQELRYNEGRIAASTERFKGKWGYEPVDARLWNGLVEREL